MPDGDVKNIKKLNKPSPITDQLKGEWNGFVNYLKQKGYSGSPVLDARDQNMGKQLLNEYVQQNPNVSLRYEHVPEIQQWLNQYRQAQWGNIQKNNIQSEAKTYDQFMPNLSATDGWLGSKTSQALFPVNIMNGKVTGYLNIPNNEPTR